MLLFLPEGVLSITAHESRASSLKVRAPGKGMITQYFDAEVYYDSSRDLPYHATITRSQIQELVVELLETMDYSELNKNATGSHYGTLLKQVHQSMNFYPDHQIAKDPAKTEPETGAPEASTLLTGVALNDAPPSQDWKRFYRS